MRSHGHQHADGVSIQTNRLPRKYQLPTDMDVTAPQSGDGEARRGSGSGSGQSSSFRAWLLDSGVSVGLFATIRAAPCSADGVYSPIGAPLAQVYRVHAMALLSSSGRSCCIAYPDKRSVNYYVTAFAPSEFTSMLSRLVAFRNHFSRRPFFCPRFADSDGRTFLDKELSADLIDEALSSAQHSVLRCPSTLRFQHVHTIAVDSSVDIFDRYYALRSQQFCTTPPSPPQSVRLVSWRPRNWTDGLSGPDISSSGQTGRFGTDPDCISDRLAMLELGFERWVQVCTDSHAYPEGVGILVEQLDDAVLLLSCDVPGQDGWSDVEAWRGDLVLRLHDKVFSFHQGAAATVHVHAATVPASLVHDGLARDDAGLDDLDPLQCATRHRDLCGRLQLFHEHLNSSRPCPPATESAQENSEALDHVQYEFGELRFEVLRRGGTLRKLYVRCPRSRCTVCLDLRKAEVCAHLSDGEQLRFPARWYVARDGLLVGPDQPHFSELAPLLDALFSAAARIAAKSVTAGGESAAVLLSAFAESRQRRELVLREARAAVYMSGLRRRLFSAVPHPAATPTTAGHRDLPSSVACARAPPLTAPCAGRRSSEADRADSDSLSSLSSVSVLERAQRALETSRLVREETSTWLASHG